MKSFRLALTCTYIGVELQKDPNQSIDNITDFIFKVLHLWYGTSQNRVRVNLAFWSSVTETVERMKKIANGNAIYC